MGDRKKSVLGEVYKQDRKDVQKKEERKQFSQNFLNNSEIKDWFQLQTFDKVNEMNGQLIKIINARHDLPQQEKYMKQDIQGQKNGVNFKVNSLIQILNRNKGNDRNMYFCKTEQKQQKSYKKYILHTQIRNNVYDENMGNERSTNENEKSWNYERIGRKKESYEMMNRKRNISNNFIKQRVKKLKRDDVEDAIQKLREIKQFQGNKNFKIGPKVRFKYNVEQQKKSKIAKVKIEPSITGYDGQWIQYDKQKIQVPCHFVDVQIRVTGDGKNGKSRRIGFTEENDYFKSYEIMKQLEYAHTVDNKFTKDLLKKIGFRNNVLVTQPEDKSTHLKTSESQTVYQEDKQILNSSKIRGDNEYQKKMIKNLFMNKDKISKVLDKFKGNRYLQSRGELKKKLYTKDDNKNVKQEIKCKKRQSFIYRTFKDHP